MSRRTLALLLSLTVLFAACTNQAATTVAPESSEPMETKQPTQGDELESDTTDSQSDPTAAPLSESTDPTTLSTELDSTVILNESFE